MGYSFHPLVRTRPMNGVVELFDLVALFTDTKGPARVQLEYEYEADEDETINRRARVTRYGLRPVARLIFDIITMAEHATLATIVNRLMSPEWAVDLALDGGIVFREVHMTGQAAPSPVPLGGKVYVGARYELRLRCVELIQEIPAIASATPSAW